MRYYSLNDYLKNEYGHKLYKLTLSCSVTCPNRDGTCGDKGCIFCSGKGSGDFAQKATEDIDTQIQKAKLLIKNKTECDKYIAYFQSYTSTYGDIDKIREYLLSAAVRNDIEIVSVATRPDCLDDKVMDILKEVKRIKPLWVELGLQTIHQSSACYIRRGYDTAVYFDAVRKLKDIGATVITHVILGLPFETKEMMIDTVRAVSKVTDGIKLQLLHVLKGTDLEREYKEGKFEVLSIEEYTDILCECINVLPENVVIHRLTGDGSKSELIAPLWTKDKKRVLNFINHQMKANNVQQGKLKLT